MALITEEYLKSEGFVKRENDTNGVWYESGKWDFVLVEYGEESWSLGIKIFDEYEEDRYETFVSGIKSTERLERIFEAINEEE